MMHFKSDPTAHLPPDVCPVCAGTLNAATGINTNGLPKSGDITICINCAALLEFNDELRLQLISEGVLSEMSEDNKKNINDIVNLIKSRLTH